MDQHKKKCSLNSSKIVVSSNKLIFFFNCFDSERNKNVQKLLKIYFSQWIDLWVLSLRNPNTFLCEMRNAMNFEFRFDVCHNSFGALVCPIAQWFNCFNACCTGNTRLVSQCSAILLSHTIPLLLLRLPDYDNPGLHISLNPILYMNASK